MSLFRLSQICCLAILIAVAQIYSSVYGQEATRLSRHYTKNTTSTQNIPPAPRLVAKHLEGKEDTPKNTPQNIPNAISIIELQQLAIDNNPTLKLLRQKINAAHGDWIQAGLKPNPVLTLGADEIGSAGKAGKHGITVEQEIITGGKRKLDRNVAGWAKDNSRKQLELQFQSIQNDVKARAYEVLAAQRIVEIREKLTEISQKSVAVAKELDTAGEVSKIDLLQVRSRANEAQALLLAAKSEEYLAWKRVACMIGIPEFAPQPISDSLENIPSTIDRDSAWATLKEYSPKLSACRSKIQQAKAALARECAGRIPDVTLSGGIQYDYAEKETLASLGVGVPLRIFDNNHGNIEKARAEFAAACRELDRQTLILYEEFAKVDETYQSSQEQVRIYADKILPDVQSALELSLKGYQQGEYKYIDILNAQQLYLESQTQYIKALKDHALASVYLDGYLATGGLDGVNEQNSKYK